MSLRDALSNTKRKEEEAAAWEKQKPKVIEEWQTAIKILFKQIREDLKEYKADGTIRFSEHQIELTEPPLGTYRIGALTLAAGPTKVIIEPRGLVFGVNGQADIYRQGGRSERDRVALFRTQRSRTEPTPGWVTSPPLYTSGGAVERVLDLSHGARRVVVLDKQVLESHLERLLKGA